MTVLPLFLQFSASLTCLGEEHFEDFGASAFVLTRVFLGADPPSMIAMGSFGLFFLFVFVIFVAFGMLNILIAQLWSTYAEIANNKQGFAMMHRAEICIVSAPDFRKDTRPHRMYGGV